MARGVDCSHCDCPFDRFIFGGRFDFRTVGVVWHFHMILPTLLRLSSFLPDELAVLKFEPDVTSGVGK